MGLAAPGWATEIIIYGSTVCTSGNQVVTWTIENGASGIPMTISFVTASIGSVQYGATGWNPSLAGNAWTAATTTVPAGVSGRLVLNVYASWSNGLTRVVGGSIDLPRDCVSPTTTTTTQPEPPTTTTTTPTTQPETTTTQPETPTTEPETPPTEPETPTTQGETPTTEATTTTIEGGTTVVTSPPTNSHTTTTLSGEGGPTPGGPTSSGPTTTTKPGPPTLPRTGTTTTFLFVFGGFFVAIGGSILMHKRNSWASLRGHETTADVRRRLEQKKRALSVYLPPRR